MMAKTDVTSGREGLQGRRHSFTWNTLVTWLSDQVFWTTPGVRITVTSGRRRVSCLVTFWVDNKEDS